MDDKQVARAKATIHTGIYNMEYAACFTKDSDGFFKRSLIESCVTREDNPIILNESQLYLMLSYKEIQIVSMCMELTLPLKKIILVL